MDDNIQDQALNDTPQVQEVTESPAVEPAEATTEAEAPEVQEVPTEEPKPRNNAQSRIRELVNEKKQVEAERNQYAELLQQANNQPIPDNLSEDEFRALQASATYAATEVQQLKRELAVERFEKEVDAVEAKFPELNPNSDQYNEKLADALSKQYAEGFIEKDRNGNFIRTRKSLEAFTSEMIDAYRDAMTKGATQTKEVLQQQAAEAAVTPQTNSQSEPKAFENLSIKEMEAQLGFHKQ